MIPKMRRRRPGLPMSNALLIGRTLCSPEDHGRAVRGTVVPRRLAQNRSTAHPGCVSDAWGLGSRLSAYVPVNVTR